MKVLSLGVCVFQMPELLNEGVVFGGLNVAPAVDNCFSAVCR